MKKLNIILLKFQILLVICLIIFLIYTFYENLLPEQEKNNRYKLELERTNNAVFQTQIKKSNVQNEVNILIEKNKNMYEEYEKWKNLNQELENQF